MPEQQLFLPFDVSQIMPVEARRRAEPDRFFFAILAPPDAARVIKDRVGLLRIEHGLKGWPIAAARLHVSLHSLGRHFQFPEELIETARDVAVSVAMRSFEITFDRVLSFGKGEKKRPFVMRPSGDVSALALLHRRLGEAMTRARLGRRTTSYFTPHMTLLYDDRAVKEQAIEPISVTVSDFALVHSLVGQSRYVELARWPLRG